MVEKIKALKKYTDCSMPANENELRIKENISGYNQAIADVVNLFSIPVVSMAQRTFTATEILNILEDTEHLDDAKMLFIRSEMEE